MAVPVPDARPGNRRALVLLAVGVALVLVVMAAGRLAGGSDDAGTVASPAATAGPTSRPAEQPAAGPRPEPPLEVDPFEAAAGKNPFTPMADASGPAQPGEPQPVTAPPAVPSTATPPPVAVDLTLPSQPAGAAAWPAAPPVKTPATTPPATTPVTAAPLPPGGGEPDAAPPRKQQRVAVLAVTEEADALVVDVRVDDVVFERLHVGAEFAGWYKVAELDSECAALLLRDERFRLCRGEEILK